MAEAFAKYLSNNDTIFESAGTIPGDSVNPIVVEVMREKGIDISRCKPKLLTRELIETCDRVITMGCSIRETCPGPMASYEDWDLDDPTGKTIEAIRDIRDQIESRIRDLLS